MTMTSQWLCKWVFILNIKISPQTHADTHMHICLHVFIRTWHVSRLSCPLATFPYVSAQNVSLNIEYVNQSNDGKDPEHDGSNYSGLRGWVMRATTGVVAPFTEPRHPNFAPHLLFVASPPRCLSSLSITPFAVPLSPSAFSLTWNAHCAFTRGK